VFEVEEDAALTASAALMVGRLAADVPRVISVYVPATKEKVE